MPKNRIIPMLGIALAIPLWAWAQDPAAPLEPLPGTAAQAKTPGFLSTEPEKPATEAESLIDEAAAKLAVLTTASADITVKADMVNQKFGLKGQYIKAPGYKLYMLLTLEDLGEASGTMLQVCDGVTLWDFTKVLDSQRCERLGFAPVLKALNRPDCDPAFRQTVLSQLGFVGPDTLLKGLRKAFDFDQTREADLDGKPVWIIGGTWKENGAPVMPGGGVLPIGAPLPPYVPSLVTLTIGKEDGWPYELLLEGRKPAQIEQGKRMEEPKLDATGRPIGKKLSAPLGNPSRILLNYSNVKLNAEIPDSIFAFSPPPSVKPEDRTDLTVAQLEQAITELANRKRADAAKTSGPVLDGSLNAPPVVPPSAEPPAATAPK